MESTRQLLAILGESEDKIELNAEESKVIAECVALVNNPNLNQTQKLAEAILKLKPFLSQPIKVLKLCDNSTVKKIFQQPSVLSSAFGDLLAKKGLPGGNSFTIKSVTGAEKSVAHGGAIATVDGSAQLHMVDQYIAASIFTRYKQSKDHNPAVLNFACEKGSYPALRARCDITRKRIKDALNQQAFPNINQDFTQLNDDLKKLGNLYWTVGHLDASCIWLDLAMTYANKMKSSSSSSLESTDPENAMWVRTFCEAAAENVYCAEILSNNPTSQQIIKDFCAKKADLQQIYHVKDWDDGVNKALAPLNLTPTETIALKNQSHKNAELHIAALQQKVEVKLR